MNVGIYLTAKPTDGGMYQYARMILRALEHSGDAGLQYYALYSDGSWKEALAHCRRINPWPVPPDSGESFWGDVRLGGLRAVRRKMMRRLCYWGLLDPGRIVIQRELRSLLRRIPIDLLIYPAGSAAAFEIGLPYVFTVPDVEHRRQPEIQDYQDQMRARDYTYRWGTKYAMTVWSYSRLEKEDVIQFYGVDGDKIRILPLLPWATTLADTNEPEALVSPTSVAEKYGLPERFVFYPAQFWMCKNHVRLVQALDRVRRTWNVSIPLVLVGSPKAAFHETMDVARALGLQEQVRYLGFVTDSEVAALYRLASGLVLPTFLGPTNIPPLEAFAVGCPVLISDLRGLREEWGDAAVYVDPTDVGDIAEKLYRFYTDDGLRAQLIERGFKIASQYTVDDFASIVNETIRECLARLQTDDGRLHGRRP